MRYLQQCAKTYIKDTHASGVTLWASVEHWIDYVYDAAFPRSSQLNLPHVRRAARIERNTDAIGHSMMWFTAQILDSAKHLSLSPDILWNLGKRKKFQTKSRTNLVLARMQQRCLLLLGC